MTNTGKAKSWPCWALGVPAAAAVGLAGLFQAGYMYVDNYIVVLITSGMLGQDNLCPYLNPLLCQGIAGLNALWAGADWYTLIGRLGLTLGVWWLCTLLARLLGPGPRLWAAQGLLAAVGIGCNLFNIYYTVQAALFAFIGVTGLLLAARRKVAHSVPVVGALFWGLGLCYRPEGALLALPFLLLPPIISLLARQMTPRRAATVLLPALVVLGALTGYRAFVFHSPTYAESIRYNNARMAVVDYPMKDWSEVADTLGDAGITENDYQSAQRLMLADTNRIDTAYLETLGRAGGQTAYPLMAAGLVRAAVDLVRALLSSKVVLFLGAVLALGLALGLLSGAAWYHKLTLGLGCGGAALILLYFQWQGRAPSRVSECVLMALGAVVFSEVVLARPSTGPVAAWVRRLLGAAALSGTLLSLMLSPYGAPQNLLAVRSGADETPFLQTMTQGSFYLWDPYLYSDRALRYFWEQGKLPSEEFLAHNLPYGEWFYGQVCFEQQLAELGIETPIEALSQPGARLVSDDPTHLLTYLQEHLDPDAALIEVGTVFGIQVWQLV